MTYKTAGRAATTVMFFSSMMPAFANPGAPVAAAGQAQTASQGTSTKSGGEGSIEERDSASECIHQPAIGESTK